MSNSDSIPHGFRQIPGYPCHAIDENGTVISVASGRWENKIPWGSATTLKPMLSTHGYCRVCLRHNGRKQHASIHTLVLTTFLGPRPDGMQCRHLDGCKTNNHVSNLAWGTPRQNNRDKIAHGTSSKGSKNGRSKLNDSDVLEIRRRAANGESRKAIANAFDSDVSNVCLIILRKTWKHI